MGELIKLSIFCMDHKFQHLGGMHVLHTFSYSLSACLLFIEPVISEGSDEYYILEDGWTVVSKDNSRSCQFEHTVLITKTGVEVLTRFYMNYESI